MQKMQVAIVITSLLLCEGWRADAQYTATVDPTTQYQTLEGFGTTLSWFANAVGGWSDPARSTVIDDLFAAPPAGLGLRYARYNIGGGDCQNQSSDPSDCTTTIEDWWHIMPSYQMEPDAAFDFTADANQQWVAQRAHSDGAVFFEAQSNSAPWWMTNSLSSTGGVNGANNLNTAYQGSGSNTFPSYLATVVAYFKSNLGIVFRGVEPFNEPDLPWTYGNLKQEGCAFGHGQEQTVIKNTASLLASANSLTNVVAPDDNSIDNALSSIQAYTSTTLADMTEVNTHTYEGTERTQLAAQAAADGKRMVMSEWGAGDTTGQTISGQIQADFEGLHPVDWAIWQPSYPGLMTFDFPDHSQTYTVNESYYVFGQYTEYIRPGYIFISGTDKKTLAAYDGYGNNLVLVTSNWTSSAVPVTYDLNNFTTVGSSAQGYRTSATQNLANIGTTAISSNSFTATLPANSVTTWVVASTTYTPAATSVNDSNFTYTGSWTSNTATGAYDGDEHYSDTPNSYYTYTFTGTQARVYGSRSANHGVAGFSVDGGAETDVDTYSSTSGQDEFVYATPTVVSGSHTIKVRVTGLNNSSATGVRVQADRIDVVN